MLKDDCLFCKIIKGDIPSDKVYEDDKILAFKDINPIVPVHVLVIPKDHISNTNEINTENSNIIAYMFEKIPEIADISGVKEEGYRLICNCGENAGQEVKHLHIHLVGGEKLGMKMA